jgi:dTDP-4-amino-4,6-dideoxygalactose transaminase
MIPAFRPFLLHKKLEKTKEYLNTITHVLTVGKITEAVENRLQRLTNCYVCLLSGGATEAFRIHARRFEKRFDTLYVQALGFNSVPSAFAEEGYKVVPVDSEKGEILLSVDDLLKCVERGRWRGVVIVTPLFGFWDADKVKEIRDRIEDEARPVDYELILDCTHLLGVYDGGYRGAISFSPTKICGCSNTGAFISPFISEVEWAKWIRGGHQVGMKEWLGTAGRRFAGEFEAAFLLASLDLMNEELMARMQLWEEYKRNLFDGVELPVYGKKYNWMEIPLKLREPVRPKVEAVMRAHGIEPAPYTQFPMQYSASWPGVVRRTKEAERFCLSHVFLPVCEEALGNAQLIMNAIREGLQ